MVIQSTGPVLLPAPKPPLLLPAPPDAPGDTFTPGNDEVVISAPPPQLSHPADKFFSDQPLGALYSPDSTTFRVFAPTANKLQLNLYAAPQGGDARTIELKRNPDGTWEASVPGNLEGHYYTYQAGGDDPGFHFEREIPDPYSQCVTACDGRSMILNDQTPVADRPSFPQQDAILYEMHLRDFTVDPNSGVQRRGQYLGLTEAGTTLTGHPEIKTGLDHISELGVNAVQIMPFSEFASDEKNDTYGWGYDPALYQTPDGWYTSQRLDGSRVREAKQMVDTLHRRGIRVVMDMVLNHTDEGLRRRGNAFEGLVPGYYYRRRKDGSNFDGAACGNEIRSEAPMVRRFIKDTLKTWVKDYKVDGFRFDLMGLMDKQTAKELTQELRQIDPNLLIYGEPWAAGETPIEVLGKGSQKNLGFGVFNDNFRDSLKGSVFQPREQGFIQSGARVEAIRKGIAGSIDDFTAGPNETINYAECHDNHTLWDRLVLSTENDPKVSESDRKAMDRLAAAVLFTSQGIPFIQSGQEMLRTKHGDDNSYNKPDSVNMIRWDQKLENRDIVSYYQGLIGLRKSHPMFHLSTAEDIRKALRFQDSPSKTIAYCLTDPTGRDPWKRAQVVFNASSSVQEFPVAGGKWRIYADGQSAGNQPLNNSAVKLENGKLKVPPRTAVILGEARATSAVAPASSLGV
ncbi:type I pullulanase [bacterium]|nr:type I pullulanase [bacterium]